MKNQSPTHPFYAALDDFDAFAGIPPADLAHALDPWESLAPELTNDLFEDPLATANKWAGADFPYSSDEAGERNFSRLLDGKPADCFPW